MIGFCDSEWGVTPMLGPFNMVPDLSDCMASLSLASLLVENSF